MNQTLLGDETHHVISLIHQRINSLSPFNDLSPWLFKLDNLIFNLVWQLICNIEFSKEGNVWRWILHFQILLTNLDSIFQLFGNMKKKECKSFFFLSSRCLFGGLVFMMCLSFLFPGNGSSPKTFRESHCFSTIKY